MSAEDDDPIPQREVAYRLFAAEFEDADFSYSESDEERAPNYVITPTGARLNRVFVVGVLTEVDEVGEDVLRGRVVDPSGAFVVYGGQYQPDAMAFLDRADPPTFVALTGKARTFQPDDSDTIYTSVRPESISEVDAGTRDRWTVQAAEQTIQRVGTAAAAMQLDVRGDELRAALEAQGVPEPLAAGIPLAFEHYGTTAAYLDAVRTLAVQAAEVVADERDEVEALTASPDAAGEVDLAALADTDFDAEAVTAGVESTEPTDEAGDETADASEETSDADPADTAEVAEAASDEAEATEAAESTGSESTADAEPSVDTPVDDSPVEEAPAEGSAGTEDVAAAESTPDPGATDTAATEDASADDGDLGDFEGGEFDLDDEEREEIEEEYGTEFQSGTEVDDPGEADIDTPDPEELAEQEAEAAAEEADAVETDDSAEEEADAATEDPADVDLETAVMDAMADLDDGDGADREELVAAVVDEHGVDPSEVEDAIQDALMSGKCYEPGDDTYKPI